MPHNFKDLEPLVIAQEEGKPANTKTLTKTGSIQEAQPATNPIKYYRVPLGKVTAQELENLANDALGGYKGDIFVTYIRNNNKVHVGFAQA